MDLNAAATAAIVGVLLLLLVVGAVRYARQAERRAEKWEGIALELLQAADLATEKIEQDRGIRADRARQREKARNWLNLLFDDEELADLLFSLGVDHNDIEGATKSVKAREIVEYFDRRGRLRDLINAIKKARPKAEGSQL